VATIATIRGGKMSNRLTENLCEGYQAIRKQIRRIGTINSAPPPSTETADTTKEPDPNKPYPHSGYSHLDEDGQPRHKRK